MKIAFKHRWTWSFLYAALLVACGDSGGADSTAFDGGSDAAGTTGAQAATSGDAGATGGAAIDGGAINGGATADGALGDAGTQGGDAAVAPSLETIDVTPTNPTAAAGTAVQLKATGIYSDESVADLTAEVTWNSDAESIATVSNETDTEGVAQAVEPGQALLTAALGDVAGSTMLTVNDAKLDSITIMPAASSVALGTEVQLSAMGTFSDGSSQDLTQQVSWRSSSEEVATVGTEPGSEGLAVTRTTGTTSFTASLDEVSGETTVTVTAAELVAIALEPTAPVLAPGTQVMLSATGIYTDASKQDVTAQATWTTGDAQVATVGDSEGEKGLVTGGSVGQTAVTASVGEVEGSTSLTVTEATLAFLAIEPEQKSLARGTILQFAALGVFSDDTVQDLSAQVTWASSDEETATVSNAAGSRGLATGVGAGSTMVTAVFGDQNASAMLTVTEALLEAIEVTPASSTLANGTTERFTATGSFSDGTVQDLTNQVSWTSEDTEVAPIGPLGWATGKSPGESTITASFGGQSGQASLEVTGAELQSMTLTPLEPSAAVGSWVSFTATGTFSDDTEQDLTRQVTWASDDPTVASIRNGLFEPGLATAFATGSTTIVATLGEVSVGTSLTVSDAVLESIEVTPAQASIGVGSTTQLRATGSFSDGSQQDLTAAVAWSAEPGSVARVSNLAGMNGRVTGRELGVATITATLGQVQQSAVLVVTGATLDAIRVTPIDTSITTGTTLQLTAVGIYSDLSEQDVTNDVTWASDDRSIATVSNAFLSAGQVDGLRAGSATVTATLDGLGGSSNLQVVDRTLESILITPEDFTLEAGSEQQFLATGVFDDDSEQDLTTQVSWSTGAVGVAVIRNLAGSEGLLTGIAPGETAVSATYDGIEGSTALTVEGVVGLGL